MDWTPGTQSSLYGSAGLPLGATGAHPQGAALHPQKLLLVSGDAEMTRFLRRGLSEVGHSVEWAGDGIDGLHLALEGDHDLLVLEAELPGLDAQELLTRLRQRSVLPAVVLSRRNSAAERIAALEAGADDVLGQPLDFCELLARLRALGRRGRLPSPPSLLRLADLELDLLRRRASRNAQRLGLSAREFQLLSLFLQRAGEVLSRTEIASRVWDINFDRGTNAVEVAIRRLRLKLDRPFAQPLLHTVRGMGYVLELR